MSYQPTSPEVKIFLAEIAALCRKHGMSLAHEDTQGAFLVCQWQQDLEDWLLDAADKTETEPR